MHVEFARTKEQLFDRWCSSNKIGSDYPKLRHLILVEEFKMCINSDVKSFLDEKEVETLEKAARLADDYTLTDLLARQILENHFTHLLVINQVLVSNLVIPVSMLQNQNLLVKKKGHTPLSQAICNYCKQSKHIDCPVFNRKREKQDGS